MPADDQVDPRDRRREGLVLFQSNVRQRDHEIRALTQPRH
jgi:hypothetical protein